MLMRPSTILLLLLTVVSVADLTMIGTAWNLEKNQTKHLGNLLSITEKLGLTDLCITTEARYTRHPAVTDPMAPFMDHPGSIEHFPSGSFINPTSQFYPDSQ